MYVTHSIDEAIVLADRLVIMTARPGRIKDIIDVTKVFGRPRTVEAVKESPRYGELFGRVWEQLRSEVLASSASESAEGPVDGR
jgi:NitT/TauT family transport system ATP-binding protein